MMAETLESMPIFIIWTHPVSGPSYVLVEQDAVYASRLPDFQPTVAGAIDTHQRCFAHDLSSALKREEPAWR